MGVEELISEESEEELASEENEEELASLGSELLAPDEGAHEAMSSIGNDKREQTNDLFILPSF